jgi:hypothetical protein
MTLGKPPCKLRSLFRLMGRDTAYWYRRGRRVPVGEGPVALVTCSGRHQELTTTRLTAPKLLDGILTLGRLSRGQAVFHPMSHKFKLGQAVEYYPSRGLFAPHGQYVISAVLPERDGEFQYHIKHPSEAHERAVRESELVEPAAAGSPPQ